MYGPLTQVCPSCGAVFEDSAHRCSFCYGELEDIHPQPRDDFKFRALMGALLLAGMGLLCFALYFSNH